MAQKYQVTLEQLEQIVSEWIDRDNLATNDFHVTRDNVVGLVDKVGKIFTLDTSFIDKLAELDADKLTYGKSIEEWYQDLIAPTEQGEVDENETDTLKYTAPTYRPVSYSYRIGTKVVKASILRYDVERAVNDASQLSSVVGTQYKRISDSVAETKYALKRELLGQVGAKIQEAYEHAGEWKSGNTLVNGAYYYSPDSTLVEASTYDNTNAFFVCVKDATAGSSVDDDVEAGVLVPLLMFVKIAKPTDATTGSAFILKVKELVEKSQDISEGYSFNGNTIGTGEGIGFYVTQGVMPNLEVNTLAGIYHLDQMGMGVTAKVIKDFGSNPANMYALLMDTRGARLYVDHEAMDAQINALKEFTNLFDHRDYTPFISRNTFAVCFVDE